MSDPKELRKILPKGSERRNDPKRREREMFRKRKMCHLRKANELAQKCNADVYMIICRKDRYYTYSSTERKGWPPDDKLIVGYSIFLS